MPNENLHNSVLLSAKGARGWVAESGCEADLP
jgi:hypothetical protein